MTGGNRGSESAASGSGLKVLWSVTRRCSFCCDYCCMASGPLPGEVLDYSGLTPHPEELDNLEKLAIIDQLSDESCSLELSGGDLLAHPDALEIIAYAGRTLGRDKVSITTTGSSLTERAIQTLESSVSRVELTIDLPPHRSDRYRSTNQNRLALDAAQMLILRGGLDVAVHTVLRADNLEPSILSEIRDLLSEIGVRTWKILRLLPVGRAAKGHVKIPSSRAYRIALRHLQDLEVEGTPMISFQYLFDHDVHGQVACRAAERSVGIAPDGEVVACFWAYDSTGSPLLEYVLGKLPQTNFRDILSSKRAEAWRSRAQRGEPCTLMQ